MAEKKRRFWVGTGWKMNKTLSESLEYAASLNELTDTGPIQGFVIPPYTLLREVSHALSDSPFKVGAQNMHWDDAGAWTGEISGSMLTDCHVDLVEIGHSERRTHFGETDATVGLKVAAALRHKLVPLICVGETHQQKESGATQEVLRVQVKNALQHVCGNADADQTIMFAYEPVWAIGESGSPASADYANEQHRHIISCAKELLNYEVTCLYGGSVNADNCEELILQTHIDGLFIGRAAWDVRGYLDILARTKAVVANR